MRGSGPLYPKLRPGPGRSTEQVVANQRARLIGAMVELVAERGYRGVTVRGLSRLAGVSTKAFYDCFRNVEDCFAATHARIVHDTLRRATDPTFASDGRPRSRIRAFFAALSEEPKAGRLVLVDAPAAGPAMVAKTRRASRALERFIVDELMAAAAPLPVQRRIADGAAAAGLHLVRSRLLSGHSQPAARIADDFFDWLLALRGGASLEEGVYAAPGRAVTEPSTELGDDRSFLLAAALRLSLREGYASLTVPAICREAGVPRRSFDQHFDGVTSCFLAAVEFRFADSLAWATHRATSGDSWERAVARTVLYLCADFGSEPGLARLSLVDVLAPGEPALRLRERTITRLARILRQATPADARPEQLAAEASVAAAIKIAASAAADGRAERIGRAAPAVAFVVLAPAAGVGVAERVIASELRGPTRGFGVRKHSTDFS